MLNVLCLFGPVLGIIAPDFALTSTVSFSPYRNRPSPRLTDQFFRSHNICISPFVAQSRHPLLSSSPFRTLAVLELHMADSSYDDLKAFFVLFRKLSADLGLSEEFGGIDLSAPASHPISISSHHHRQPVHPSLMTTREVKVQVQPMPVIKFESLFEDFVRSVRSPGLDLRWCLSLMRSGKPKGSILNLSVPPPSSTNFREHFDLE